MNKKNENLIGQFKTTYKSDFLYILYKDDPQSVPTLQIKFDERYISKSYINSLVDFIIQSIESPDRFGSEPDETASRDDWFAWYEKNKNKNPKKCNLKYLAQRLELTYGTVRNLHISYLRKKKII